MRRSFSNNRLYSVVFYEHLKKLMQRGHSIEFFLKEEDLDREN